MPSKPIYRVVFHNQGEVWELYAREIFQSDLWGFIEVEAFVFEDQSEVVVDPGAEKLRRTFDGVNRSYIPYSAIVRIDEVERGGVAKKSGVGQIFTNLSPMPRQPADSLIAAQVVQMVIHRKCG